MSEEGRIVERRIVSVLFADLVGFTGLAERLDAEDVAAVQDRYFAAARETVGRHGGVLEKFIGDAVMAAFGIPVARDDDAERAVRAGLALASAVDRLGAQLGPATEELAVRVGVTTGEVVHAEAGPDAGRLTGDIVNTAARLQVAAPPGRVLVDRSTALAVAEAIEVGPLQPFELKGKAAPVPAALVIGVRPERSRELAMGGLRAATLGRDGELARLEAALEEVSTSRTGIRMLVVAPPGTGKTRLLEEFAGRALAAGAAVRRLRFRADDPRPFGALADLFGPDDLAHLGAVAGGPVGAVPTAESAGHGAGRAEVVRRATEGLIGGSASGGADRAALFEAWLDALETLDARDGGRPTTWLVEDVHWAGPDALAFLDAALDRPGPVGRLVVAAARPSLLERAPAWSEPSERVARLDLGGLGAGDAATLVRALVGDALPPPLVARVVDASDGNCLFIEELVRAWASVGLLRRAGDGWELTSPTGEVPVPTTVQAVYGAQLDDLPPEPRRIVRRGSVAGRRLPARALPVLGIEDADTALGGLVRRALLDGPVTDAVAGEAYLYRHALLRDAGYSSLSHAERAALHVRMARWLEAAAGSRSDAVAEAIGGHCAAAADGAPLLALEVGDGLGREDARALAAAWLERAAGASLAAGAMAAAAELYARAADRTDPARKLDRSRRSRRAGETAARVGDMGGAAARLETAMEAAREAAGDPVSAPAAREALAVAAASLSRVVAEQLGFERAWTLAEEVLAEIGAGDDPPAARLRLRAAVARGMFSDDPAEVVEVARQALEVAQRAGDRELELDALPALLSAVENRDELALAAERLAAVGRREGRWDLVVRALRIGATIAVESGSDPGPLFDEAQEIAADRGLAEALGWICHDRALFAFRAGDWSSARAAGLAALDLALPRAYLRICVRAWLVLVPVAAWTGDRELLEQADRWFADNLPRLPDSPYGRLSQAAVDVALSGAELVAAPDLAPRRLLPSFEGDLGGPDWSETLDTVVRAWIEGGRIDAVRDAVRACRRHLPGAGLLEVGTVGLLAARWERAAGRPEQAGREAREALASFRAARAPWWIAKSLRLLEDVGAASAAEVAEARAIEAGLGVVGRAP